MAKFTWSQQITIPLLFLVLVVLNAQNIHRRFEYKYSFKPPYLAQKDGSVPFWVYSGNAIANEEMVRVTPSLRSQKGSIWTQNPVNFDWWEVEMIFRVTGRGRVGADGLAFWYTEQRGVEGPVFGSSDNWNGLGVFFDSFDNDNKHNNPYIMAMTNDGTRSYEHQLDGSTQQLAGCLRDFRNKPFPVRAKIEYYQNTLTVMFHSGMSNSDKDYEMCLRVDNVILPKNGFFGVSAATGGLADDHDVLKFLTNSLHNPDAMAATGVAEDERQKLAQEYQDYQAKLEREQEAYVKEHPDAKPKEDPHAEEYYESDQERELRQIFTGQSKMFDAIHDLRAKLDEIVGRQERTLSLVGLIQSGQAGQVPAGQLPPPGGVQMPPDVVRRQDLDGILANQRDIVGSAREIKAYVTEIHQRTNSILQNQGKAGTGQAQVQSIGYDHVQAALNEMKEGLNHVRRELGLTSQKLNAAPQASASCPTANCLTTTVFLVFAAIQLILLIGFFVYRDNKEVQSKKFY